MWKTNTVFAVFFGVFFLYEQCIRLKCMCDCMGMNSCLLWVHTLSLLFAACIHWRVCVHVFHFKTQQIFHPNVSEKGEVCLDILKEKWTPALTIGKVLLTISSLMEDPNPDNPLNQEAGSLLSKDPQEFRKVASEWTATYAGGAGVGGSS